MRATRHRFEHATGAVVVRVAVDETGVPCGSEVRYDGRAWRLSSWPSRIDGARPVNGGVAVRADGVERLLADEDAL